jgi:hypothetical protein
MSSSHSGPGDPRRRIGARVRASHLDQAGRREEFEGVVVGCQKYGVNVRLTDGTVRGFSDVEVSPSAPESPGEPAGRSSSVSSQLDNEGW